MPRARDAWRALARATRAGSLPLARVGATFGRLCGGAGEAAGDELADDDAVRRAFDAELGLLLAPDGGGGDERGDERDDERVDADGDGGGGESESDGDPALARATCARWLGDFALLRRLARWLPALLALHELFEPLYAPRPEGAGRAERVDACRDALAATLATLEADWGGYTLASCGAAAITDDARDIVALCGPATLDYLAALADAPRLLGWLVAHASTDEFNQLLSVVRPRARAPTTRARSGGG